MRRAAMWSLVMGLVALACGPPGPAPGLAPSLASSPAPSLAPSPPAVVAKPAPEASPRDDGAQDDVAAYASEILSRAAATEPEVTPRLVAVAEKMGGEMYKLEHRLKTRASTERKIRAKMAEDGLALREVVIDDALRYTMKVDDVPPGRHVQAIKAVLDELARMGHAVVRLKNYWPAGDNYSGINGVLEAPNGLLWELQFHTSDSIRTQAETRAMYEELRRVNTPEARKRELFDAMTEKWDAVPIPKGILVVGALHDHAEIIERPRP